ncbi:MAG: ABC1 kinase family protein [Phototrophicaceae bacterium]
MSIIQKEKSNPVVELNAPTNSVIGSIARPPAFVSESLNDVVELPPYEPRVDFDADLRLQVTRGIAWLRAIVAFFLGTLLDIVLPWREDNDERRATRLATIIQELGGTVVKLGQQLSMRIDFLPYEYYTKLSKLFNEVPVFDFKLAIIAIEDATGEPISKTFERIDPKPIGAGAVACVYQAVLRKNGKKVAVKVRRPGVGEVFAADFDIIKLIFLASRFLNLLPRIITFEAIDELHDLIMEELDFKSEARHQDMFRRAAELSERRYFSAPRVYFEYSSDGVIVQEYIQGVLLKDLLTIVERNDTKGLQRLAIYDIDPKEVSRRLLWTNYWTIWRTLFFHADPHPANVLVLPHNELVFIDFGSVGSLGSKLRWALQEVYEAEARMDVEAAARTAITLMEPLPPLDVNKLLADTTEEFQRATIALRSEGVPWQERTTAQLWFGFFRVARKYDVSLPSSVVRLIRGTLLYDTLAARLHTELNINEVYDQYRRDAGMQAGRALGKEVRKRIFTGPDPEDFLRIEQLISEGSALIFQGQRLLSDVTYKLQPLTGQVVLIFSTVFSIVMRLSVIWLSPIFLAYAYYFVDMYFEVEEGESIVLFYAIPEIWPHVVDAVLTRNWYWFTVIFLSIVVVLSTTRRFVTNAYRLDD